MTMSSEVLSQEEIDALLNGSGGDAADDAGAEAIADPDGVRRYDLANPDRIVRIRTPTLDMIHDRFARNLRVSLYNFVRRTVMITSSATRTQKYKDFINGLVMPTNLNVVALKSLRGSCLVVMEPSLVFALVDNMFGGDGRFHMRVEGREFTATEQRIIHRVLEIVLDEYKKAWAPIHPLEIEFTRSEMLTQFANIASASETVLTASFAVEIGPAQAAMHICLPYSSLETVKDALSNPVGDTDVEREKRWLAGLTRQVQSAEVTLAANLTTIPANVGQLISMKPGDVIALDLHDRIVANVDGAPIFECSYGTMNGRYGIRVERVLAVPDANEHNTAA